jgi:hypothetical protein
MWCTSGSAACDYAGHGNGVAVGWRAICGISFNWMISGRRGCRPRDIKRGFKAIATRGGVPDVTAHILRHTACTWMMQAGVPTAEIAGYAAMAEATVQRIYGHHSPDYMQHAVAALASRLPEIGALPSVPLVKRSGQMTALGRLRGVSSPIGEVIRVISPQRCNDDAK